MRDTTSSYVIDFRCALDFGEGQAKAKSGGGKEEKRRSGEGHRTAAQSWVLKSRLFILQVKFADFGV